MEKLAYPYEYILKKSRLGWTDNKLRKTNEHFLKLSGAGQMKKISVKQT